MPIPWNKVLAVFLAIAVPLAWGLVSAAFFEWLRQRKPKS
jgi:hypothetical protein